MTADDLKKILSDHALWRDGNGGSKADLRWADLSGADLSGADLSGADLSGADLIGANLGGANLGGASLIGANLSGADLIGVNLVEANLRWADLSGASLGGASLIGANLGGANLGGASLIGASLIGANLSGETKAVGLIARATRIIDPYEFFAWQTDKGPRIKAGCNFLTPAGYRAHVAAKYPNTDKAAETLRILDFFDASFAAIKPEATS